MRKVSSLSLRTFLGNIPCGVTIDIWEDGKLYSEVTYEFVIAIPEQFLYKNWGMPGEVEEVDHDRISRIEMQVEYLREAKSPFKRVEVVTHKRAATTKSMAFYRKYDKKNVKKALRERKASPYGKIKIRAIAKGNVPNQAQVGALKVFINKTKWKS